MRIELTVRLVVTGRSGPHVEVLYGDQALQMPIASEEGEDGPVACNTEGKLTLDVVAPRPGAVRAMRHARKLSQKQERELAAAVGGWTQPASGALEGAKGDFRVVGVTRAEAKSTMAASYRLELEDLQKIRSECTGGEKPSFVIRFLRKDGRTADEFAVLPIADWAEWVQLKSRQRK